MFNYVKKTKKPLSIKDFYERRNKILIKRMCGGFGDILMQRMIFEDIKNMNLEVSYACPYKFIEVIEDHPFIDNILEVSCLQESKYGQVYDISTICSLTESRLGEQNKFHKSDIWSNYCGYDITNHKMHIQIDEKEKKFCSEHIKKVNPNKKPIVLICSKSGENDLGKAKTLTKEQTTFLINYCRIIGMIPITTDEYPQEIYSKLEVLQFVSMKPKTWLALVSLCDLVISVDTATFHMAGGLGVPLVGVFSFTDGKIYGKYYDFVLVQKHRDNGNWDCGPCFKFMFCSKEPNKKQKPCITEIAVEELKKGIDKAIRKWNIKTQDGFLKNDLI